MFLAVVKGVRTIEKHHRDGQKVAVAVNRGFIYLYTIFY